MVSVLYLRLIDDNTFKQFMSEVAGFSSLFEIVGGEIMSDRVIKLVSFSSLFEIV